VNRLDQETAKRRGPTRAVEPFKNSRGSCNVGRYSDGLRAGRPRRKILLLRYASSTEVVDALILKYLAFRPRLEPVRPEFEIEALTRTNLAAPPNSLIKSTSEKQADSIYTHEEFCKSK
jgi:hypothetical protein